MAIVTRGDVRPSEPRGFPYDPGTGPPTGADTDSDGVPDWIPDEGDDLIISGVVDEDPTGAGPGAAWNVEAVWNEWDHPSDVEIGKYEWGYMSIGASSRLKREQIVIGEYGDGVLSIASTSQLNNDPRIVVGTDQVAINLAKGEALHAAEVREGLEGAYAGSAGGNILASTTTIQTRAVDQDNDLRVGVNGTARMYIQSSSWVEILRKMTIAENATSTGYVEVNNAHLIIDGRTEEEADDAARTTSIGGSGVGELVIADDGTVTIGFLTTIGERGKVTMRGGRLTVATIDLTDDPIAPAASTLTNNGIIVVEEGTNVINATVVNNGEIYVAPGATLIFKGTCSGNAPKRSVCGAPAIVIGWTAGAGGSNPLPAGKVEPVV